jgi:hypothetical protein
MDFPGKDSPSNEEIIKLLDVAGTEITHARDIISGKVKDAVGYYDEVNEKKTDTIK